jgi:pimeloyl-ACP methyl ester carboxylesterase
MKLVLLPGMDGTGDLFEPLLKCLPPRLEPIVVRYPSDLPGTYGDLEGLVRDTLPTDEPYAILGESFSGPVAIGLAASEPRGLVALILSCSFARNPYPKLARLGALVGALPIHRLAFAARSMLLGSYSTDECRSALESALAKVTPEVIGTRLREVLAVDVTEKLHRLRIPILYLRATKDRAVPKSALEEIQRHSTLVQSVDIDGPHGLLQVKPGAAAAVIDRFLLECL